MVSAVARLEQRTGISDNENALWGCFGDDAPRTVP